MSDNNAEQYQSKWSEYQLGQLASLAQQKVFYIPRFQRDFVWNTSQIRLLADSVARNYPIGSLLLLAENQSTLQLSGRPISALIREEEEGQEEGKEDEPLPRTPFARLHVLDGQQRLTSLVRVFANISPTQMYYVDLVKVLESFGPARTEETDWLVARRRPTVDGKVTKNRGALVRADVVLDVKKTSLYIDEFIDEVSQEQLPEAFRGTDDESKRRMKREAKATLTQVFETIRNYRVPAIVIDRESPLSAICRIFETINSTGRRLTTFDLAVASFYPQPDLRTLWEETLLQFPRFKHYDLDGERVLQLLVLQAAERNKTNLVATRSAIIGMKPDVVRDGWPDATRALDKALTWAETEGCRPPKLPQEPVIIALASFLGTAGVDDWLKRTPNSNGQLQRWYFSKILQPGARGAASNYIIGKDFQDLLAWFREDKALPVAPVRLSAAQVMSLTETDVRYKALFSLLVREVKQDVRTQRTLGDDDAVEDHHIFPRSFERKHKLNARKLGGIANRLPVSKTTNLQFGQRAPEEYLREMLSTAAKGSLVAVLKRAGFGDVDDTEAFLERVQIPQFEAFVAARAERLLDVVATILNGQLNRRGDDGEDDDE
jgi:hypothetical protein